MPWSRTAATSLPGTRPDSLRALITISSQLENLYIWGRGSNAFGWHCYLGDRNGTDDVPFDVAPARCPDLQGLPPTFISVGGADGFRDEDIDYALRLYQAAVAWAKCASDE